MTVVEIPREALANVLTFRTALVMRSAEADAAVGAAKEAEARYSLAIKNAVVAAGCDPSKPGTLCHDCGGYFPALRAVRDADGRAHAPPCPRCTEEPVKEGDEKPSEETRK